MNKQFYIYGAGIVATSIYTAIKQLYHHIPLAFLVSDKKGNPTQMEGIPVLELSEIGDLDSGHQIVIATPEMHHEAIAKSLYELGVHKEQLRFVDNGLENSLMESYYSEQQDFKTVGEWLKNLADGEQKQDIAETEFFVFQAKCHVDKPLKNKMQIPDYVKPIQVGTAFTDESIAPIKDNAGDNISGKNRNYCELTATYYAWKNSGAQYKGLCHYRRLFDISEQQLQSLLGEMPDVILPYPSIHYPDMDSQHKRYVNDQDWNAMLQAMKEVAPEYYEAYVTDVSKQHYFYNYNMLIARREVFDDYCSFLFAVLERTEELTNPKGWERADRFAGYLGENLTTIYFRKNREKLRIVHAGKLWLT